MNEMDKITTNDSFALSGQEEGGEHGKLSLPREMEEWRSGKEGCQQLVDWLHSLENEGKGALSQERRTVHAQEPSNQPLTERYMSLEDKNLQRGKGLPADRILRAKFILAWKKNADGSPRAKARLVVQGFKDSDALSKQFKEGSDHEIWVGLPQDADVILGIEHVGGKLMKLIKSIYALCDAWHEEATERILRIGGSIRSCRCVAVCIDVLEPDLVSFDDVAIAKMLKSPRLVVDAKAL
eukprot:s527_g15.t1